MSKTERPVSEDINIGNGPDQFVRKHESGVFESKGESYSHHVE